MPGRRCACRCTCPGPPSARRSGRRPARLGPARARTGPEWSSDQGRRTTRSSPRYEGVLRYSCLLLLMTCGQLVAAHLPFVGVDAHEVGFLTGFKQRHAAADPGVAQNDRWLPDWIHLAGDVIERGQQRVDVVAVDPQDEPPAGLPFVGDRLDAQYPGGGSVGLQRVDVAQRGEVSEPVVAGAHRGFPRRALVELAVGKEVDDPYR